MGLIRFVVTAFMSWVFAVVLVLILDITLTSFGLPLNKYIEIPLQIIIFVYGVSKLGVKRIKNKYNDLPN
jgi:hypothetical protein